MRKILLFSIIILLTLSCTRAGDSIDSNDSTDILSIQNKILPVKMTVNEEILNVNYNDKKILNITGTDTKFIFTYNDDSITNIKYYQKDKIKQTTDYEYINGVINSQTIKSYNIITEKQISTVTYIYQHESNNRVNVKKTIQTLGIPKYTLSGYYTLKDNNIISLSTAGTRVANDYSLEEVKEIGTYEYNDNKYPFKNVKGFDKLLFTGEFGISSELFSNMQNGLKFFKYQFFESNQFMQTTYKYIENTNKYGYPSDRTKQYINANGIPDTTSSSTITYQYNY